MHPFSTHVLRSYYKATGWNEDNLFANFTRSSSAILDFTIPRGLNVSVSKSPNAHFKTTYAINAMPYLHGSVGYIYTSCDLNVRSSANAQFKDVIDCFKIYDQPHKPDAKEEEWLAGERVDIRDYLMYGRLHLPSRRLDALYSTRLTSTLQALVAVISEPPLNTHSDYRRNRTGQTSNVMFNLQHDVGKWCTEYTYSAEDDMWGIKLLHNLGRLSGSPDISEESDVSARQRTGIKRVDEEEPIEGGLRGRVSVGAELYASAKERSAGVSAGIRFTTFPDATPPSYQLSSPMTATQKAMFPQPPTTITALFNPMLGYVAAAYTAQASQDLSLSSRFEFNVYSFESDWTMGAEWWLRSHQNEVAEPQGVHGVLKARASTSSNVALLWEGRLKSMLVSLGVLADLSHRSKPLKGVGLEVSYFSSD
ncbi:hypothetical protein M378DRAFT_158874 [Amanita muscaria Koide BX008]|uniref:Mitochondrial distribution and morphology protein 10 n=1 Tax=Amanita muscaria (strain Koide BX008) TaxID=946122 RepID=A0A0C2TMD4_AMAMK|nr:hypothetical protein M378DRAFT_158874 [Amanita muscaria Koide BX008]